MFSIKFFKKNVFLHNKKYILRKLLGINIEDEVAEWLRRWTANPLGSARVGSNPILVGFFFVFSSGN
jgi:hypothetical protein